MEDAVREKIKRLKILVVTLKQFHNINLYSKSFQIFQNAPTAKTVQGYQTHVHLKDVHVARTRRALNNLQIDVNQEPVNVV